MNETADIFQQLDGLYIQTKLSHETIFDFPMTDFCPDPTPFIIRWSEKRRIAIEIDRYCDRIIITLI